MEEDSDRSTPLAQMSYNREDEPVVLQPREPLRNCIAFWLLGLCNNFGYVIMLSAAFDILRKQQGKNTDDSDHEGFKCNPTSTGLVLLADVLPALLVKITAPFYMQRVNYHIRVALCIVLFMTSLVIVAYSGPVPVSLLGVIFASISSGIGEITFLAFSSYYTKVVISFWSSGTGMAGLAGSLAYAGMTQLGLSSKTTLLLLLSVGLIWAISFWVILLMPEQAKICCNRSNHGENESLLGDESRNNSQQDRVSYMPLLSKLEMMKPLLRFMVPLFLVYLAEYTINQGLYELLYYDTWLKQAQQYRWYQVDYQLAVFISRSSIQLVALKNILVPTFIQWGILVLLIVEASVPFMKHIWITLGIVFLEGLCGGAVYVNAFTMISEASTAGNREFRMGAASMADSFGITLAGLISIPIHNAICGLRS